MWGDGRHRPENLTRTPPFTRRGVPVVDGFVCTNDTWSNRFCTPKKTCRLRPTSRTAVKSTDAYPGNPGPVNEPYPASASVAAGIKLTLRSSLYCNDVACTERATLADFGFEYATR